MQDPLTSTANATVKRLCRLHTHKGRREQGRFLVEGKRIISGFLDGGAKAIALFVRDNENVPAEWPADICIPISTAVADKISQHRQASGFVAEFELPEAKPINPHQGGLILDGINDPGNAGTLLRTAAAFGMRQIACFGPTVDLYNHKVVQASAGALASISVHLLDQAELPKWECPLVGLAAHDGHSAAHIPDGPKWLIVGSEAHGLSPTMAEACTMHLTLPMQPEVESLNAGVAGALGIFLCQGLHKI